MEAYIHELVTFSNLLCNHSGLSRKKQGDWMPNRAAAPSMMV